MKILVAMDSFEGSLDAVEASAAVHRGLLPLVPQASFVLRPMADGGPGTARVLLAVGGGSWIPVRVTGPFPGTLVEAGFAWLPRSRTAFVEAATACGSALVAPGGLDPLTATSTGAGELLEEAIALGAERLLLGAGDVASIDGGMGAAAALGVRFLDADGQPVAPCGGRLARVDRIDLSGRRAGLPPIAVMCRREDPLLGPHGAARAQGPRKGAGPPDVLRLEAGLHRFEAIVRQATGVDLGHVPGSGAAGGLAYGAAALLGATLVPGAEALLAALHVEDDLRDADWVVTGTAVLDAHALDENIVGAVARAAVRAGKPVAVVAERIELDGRSLRAAGIEPVLAIGSAPQVAPEAGHALAARLSAAARQLGHLLFDTTLT